jgi:hypothetical protein
LFYEFQQQSSLHATKTLSQVYCLLTIEVSTHGHAKVGLCVIIAVANANANARARASAIVNVFVGRSHGDVVLLKVFCSGNEFMRAVSE